MRPSMFLKTPEQGQPATVPTLILFGSRTLDSLLAPPIVIGSTRILSEKQTPSSPHYHSRSFPKYSPAPVLSRTSGAPILRSPSKTPCMQNQSPRVWCDHAERHLGGVQTATRVDPPFCPPSYSACLSKRGNHRLAGASRASGKINQDGEPRKCAV